MQPPTQFTARLEEKNVLNEKFIHYSFELTNPHTLDFAAGQYISIQVSDRGERRSYSICSSPGIKHGFELLVDVSPRGLGVQFLEGLKFGDEISILAPMGRFVLEQNSGEEAIALIATGSGIAPFRSMVFELLQEQQDKREIILYWGLRRAEDMVWEDEFQDLVDFFPNFKFHPVLSQAPSEWPLCRGRVTDCLNIHPLPEVKTGYYLCGNNKMIEDVKSVLSAKGIVADQIHHEKFY